MPVHNFTANFSPSTNSFFGPCQFVLQVKRRKTKEENSDQSPNNSSSKLVKESECKSENENKEQNKKAEKRKERRQKKKEKKALLIKQNHIHEGKGQNRAIR